MTTKKAVGSLIACTAVVGIALFAQENPPSAQPGNLDLTGLPAPRGIYYHADSQWVSLSSTILMPFAEGKGVALEILNVGSDHVVAELPGPHAGVQIGNSQRPTFFLHGIDPSGLYLVRSVSKADYRELRMPVSRHFWEWAHFRSKDLEDIEIQEVNGDLVAIKPRADLKPGEYVLASAVESGDHWLRLGFGFGIVGSR